MLLVQGAHFENYWSGVSDTSPAYAKVVFCFLLKLGVPESLDESHQNLTVTPKKSYKIIKLSQK